MILMEFGHHISSSITIGIDGRFLQDKFHGIGRYTYGLLAGLCSIRGDHRLVLFIDPALPNSRFPIDSLVTSGKLELCQISIPLYHPRELWEWPAVLRNAPVDVFHSPYFWSPILLPCPSVTTIHDMIFDRYPQYIPGRRFLLPYKIMTRLALRKSSYVITVSEATKRDVVQFTGTRQDKIVTILAGVEAWFEPVVTADECARVRNKYGLPSSYILALGARRPHKNIPRLVSAFSRVMAEIPHTLVLAGTIDERFSDESSANMARLKRDGRVLEIAYVEEQDLNAIYSSAALFVQPSIIEGFGLPVLEAMACGCPVACSNTSSLPEVAGDAAMLFDPLSETEIAETIRCVLLSSDLRHNLSERGRQRARQFSWEVAARKTLDVYQRAALTTRELARART